MSELEETLAFHMRAVGLPEPVREYRFASPRRWRFDFAWLDQMVAAEVEGGTWVKGRHNRAMGFAKDCGKYNRATLLGWRVFRFTGDMIDDGIAIKVLEEALTDGNARSSYGD